MKSFEKIYYFAAVFFLSITIPFSSLSAQGSIPVKQALAEYAPTISTVLESTTDASLLAIEFMCPIGGKVSAFDIGLNMGTAIPLDCEVTWGLVSNGFVPSLTWSSCQNHLWASATSTESISTDTLKLNLTLAFDPETVMGQLEVECLQESIVEVAVIQGMKMPYAEFEFQTLVSFEGEVVYQDRKCDKGSDPVLEGLPPGVYILMRSFTHAAPLYEKLLIMSN